MSETLIVREILARLGRRPDMRLWRNNTGAVGFNNGGGEKRYVKFGVPGQADCSGILHDGKRLEVEAKTERGKQTPEQKNFETMIRRFGGVYILARSADDAENQLEAAGYPRPFASERVS